MVKHLIFWVCLIWAAGSSAAARDAAPDFALIDHAGRFHQLSRHIDQKLVVLMAYQPSCQACQRALPELISLQRRYRDAPVSFQVLVVDSGQTRESLAELAAELDTDLPLLLDSSQLVTESLGFTRAGEVLVVNPTNLQILYRGGIGLYQEAAVQQGLAANLPGMTSHVHYLVHSILRDEPFIQDAMPLRGDALVFDRLEDVRSRDISYEHDVAPILIERCVDCHRVNGMAPWVMEDHLMIQGWSRMIRETLLTRRMPPGQIDYAYADRYDDVNHISEEEMTVLIEWIESGAPSGDMQDDPLEALGGNDSTWELGEPDLILELPEQHIPATGVLDYTFAPIELNLTEDRWVSAYAFDVDNKAALHHVILYTQDARQRRQNASRGGSRTNFGGYAPGREHVSLGPDNGILLGRDMRLMVQFHYTTIGREVTDRTRLGLYFHDTPPANAMVRTAVMSGDFLIPPGERNYPVMAETVIAEDSYLHSFAPHMHYRGRHIRFRAEYPDGTGESLLSIPNFQNHWQMVYRLKEPVFLPGGTRIVAEGGFDNSIYNPLNPDPQRAVGWGDQIWDEMFLTWLRVSDAP